jgi:phosphoribosylformylglycinamidine synthase
MPHRIEVAFRPDVFDAAGETVRKRIVEDLGIGVSSVKTADVYTVDAKLSREQLEMVAKELFSDPIIQNFSVDKPVAVQVGEFDWLIEVGFKPGVTDNVGKTAKEGIEDILKTRLDGAVYTSRQYLIRGKLERSDIEKIASELLANDLIQRWTIMDFNAFKRKGVKAAVPKVELKHRPSVKEINLNVSPEKLLEISEKRHLALNLEEMLAIRNYFTSPKAAEERKGFGLSGKPTDVELEAVAQTWSEHCKHKIFNAEIEYECNGEIQKIDGLFNTFIRKSTEEIRKRKDWILSVFWDNAGVIRFNDDWLFSLKCETHNSPSNMEPYGGALTGIVGVYRDPMGTGKGSRLVFGTYGFCTGYPAYKGDLNPKIHPKMLLEGVRKGVEDGGNKSGIPTPYGIVLFDDGYMGKCIVYVAAGGLIPSEVGGRPGYEKKAASGDLIVMAGGRIGIDGIHGVTASSEKYSEHTPASHVQIGDPITQKNMMDFLVEARDRNLYTCITDNGGGGLSSSVGESARFSGGAELHLDKAPLKYAGLDPWQILLSESQERMTLAVPEQKRKALFQLAEKHGVEVTVLGKYTDSGKFHILYKGKTVALLDMEFLHSGLPKMKLKAKWRQPELGEPAEEKVPDYNQLLIGILSRPNICSKEYIVRQFDHEVQAGSVIKPLVGKESDVYSDAIVLRPVLTSMEGLAVSAGINPKFSQIDTYHMAANCIDEAIRRIIAVGGSLEQIALNDNFCWPSVTDDEYKLAQLVRANQALYDYTTAFGTPCISGKDSMFVEGDVMDKNGDLHRLSALPTLQFTAVGKIDDVRKCVTMDVKRAGDYVYVLGMTKDELGASEYYEMLGYIGKNVPRVDAEQSRRLYNRLSSAIHKGLVSSAHGCYRGGLAIALAQSSFAGGLGIELHFSRVPETGVNTDDKLLFSESAGRFVVTVQPKKAPEFESLMAGTVFSKVGRVRIDKKLIIHGLDEKTIIDADIDKLKKAWKSPMEW